jgi:uncharacterized protein YggE
MEGLVNQRVNKIDNVVFSVSKLAHYQQKLENSAMKDAKLKVEDHMVSFREKGRQS